ncbi:MAG: DNA replication and repair protein RecF, partial [Saprospiraceae bacterium]|nr:DNA replication and repair protein RecF [Saprospiraceae bacterium]
TKSDDQKLHFRYIKLTNFKSYSTAEFEFADKLNLIFGLNGAGKTNLLDAIYCLAMTQSNFKVPDQQLIKIGQDFYRLEAGLVRKDEQHLIVIKSQKRAKKVIEKDEVAYQKLAEHIGFIPIVMVAPDDLELVTGGNSLRRTLIDRTISQVDRSYLKHSIDYLRLLKQRNALLKQFLEGRSYDEVLLTTYDEKMWVHADYIYRTRANFLAAFHPALNELYTALCGGTESISLIYENQVASRSYLEIAVENRARDRLLGRSTVGPHADKLSYIFEDRDMKLFGSQGQKKSAIFATKLAQYRYLVESSGLKPILLLDDIFDRLDHERVGRLLGIILKDNFGQIFITDTEAGRLEKFLDSPTSGIKQFEIS